MSLHTAELSHRVMASVPSEPTVAASLESSLIGGGRVLLTFGMALFVSYLLLMVGSLLVAVVAGRVLPIRGTEQRGSDQHSPAELRSHAAEGRAGAVLGIDGSGAEDVTAERAYQAGGAR